MSTLRTVAGKTWRGIVAAAQAIGAAVLGVLLVLPCAWGLYYAFSHLEPFENDYAFLWFFGATASAVVGTVLLVAASLIRSEADRVRLDRAAFTGFRTAVWLFASGMLTWIGQNAFDVYERFAPVPLWVDRCAAVAYWISPAPAAIAFWLYVVDGLKQSLSRSRRTRPLELSQSGTPGEN